MRRARTKKAKDERRKVLLNAALDLFFEKGFAAARMEDIAARAGVTKGTVYLYFSSKEELFKDLISVHAIPNVQRLESLVTGATSSEEAIRGFVKFVVQILSETQLPKFIKVLIGDSGAFPGVIETYRETVLKRIFSAVAAMLRKGNELGEFNVTDLAMTTRLFVAPVIFATIWRMVFESEDEPALDLEGLFSLHADLMIRALRAPVEEV